MTLSYKQFCDKYRKLILIKDRTKREHAIDKLISVNKDNENRLFDRWMAADSDMHLSEFLRKESNS